MADYKTPLHIIVLQDHFDQILEAAFVKNVLFHAIERPVIFLPVNPQQPVPIVDNCIYLSLCNTMVPTILAAIDHGKKNVGVLHMGDELGDLDCSWYGRVDYVLRNYWFEDRMNLLSSRCRNILWIPNGYGSGVGPRSPSNLAPTSLRTISYYFAGSIPKNHPSTAERIAMRDALIRHKLPAMLNVTDGFGQGLKPPTYAAFLENARFALIPRGRAEETIRLFVALECGAIPVTLPRRFLNALAAMKNAPLIQLDSWDLLNQLDDWASATPSEDIDRIQRDMLSWWGGFKATVQRKVAEAVERSFRTYGVR